MMDAGKLTHSQSQPGGMDRTPPGTPKKAGKMLAVRVQMLDDTITMFQVQAKALGKVLFDQVCNQLHLLESDYFGLEYQEVGGTKYWLDLEKPLSRQIGLSLVDTLVRFCVKFYTPDPSQLEEEFTRYLFCLQIKRDLSQGLLQCNSNTAALMASYIVQAECGDYVVEDYPDHRYLSSYKFVPNQDQELERRIMENHKKHAGQSPAEADLNLLETARRCELYGIKMHPAKGYYKDTVEFFFEGRNECKNFWKKCVENHGFFRCSMVKKVPRQKTRVLSRGSSFRYSGRTQKQIVEFVRENYVKRQTFQRSQSFRHSSSAHSSVANVGTSISAHPLLPLGDNAVAGTPASLSCGSMTLTSSPLHAADIHAGGSPSPPLTTSVSPGTSITSSPQHFYPQETPYRRPGHQHSKVKHPHVRSRRAISPLQSPTSVVTAANNHSANLSNNNSIIMDNGDVKSSRISLKSSDYANFNDVYSNCYSSLRSLRHTVDNEMNDNETKTDIFDLTPHFLSKSNESAVSLKKSKASVCKDPEDVDDRYTWHRSVSCKDLYHEENLVVESKNEKIGKNAMSEKQRSYEKEAGYDSPVTRYDDSRRKCYSAATSKNPSVDRTGDVVPSMKIYSSSYPGTTSSLSTESAEGEPEDRVLMVDVKYDSQEEIVLSHDDVSHDSYELLERELEEYDDDSFKTKSRKNANESDRTRSCSWGSDRGIGLLDSRSTDNVVGSSYAKSQENGFWSLERERSGKHKSEIDFRSLDRKSPKRPKTSRSEDHRSTEKFHGGAGRRVRNKEPFILDNRIPSEAKRKGVEIEDQLFGAPTRISPMENRIPSSKNFDQRELYLNLEQEARLPHKPSREMFADQENFGCLDRKMHSDRRRNRDELDKFLPLASEEDSIKGEQIRVEERRNFNRKREKRDKEERFHEGIKEKEQKEWEKEKEKRQMDRRRGLEEKLRRSEEESAKKANDYANFQEIHFKKFDRVVSNQFGKYSEFLIPEKNFDLLAQERKVIENYEKVCQVGRIAKELEKSQRANLLTADSPKQAVPLTAPAADSFLLDGRRMKEHEEGWTPDLGQFHEFHGKAKSGVAELVSSPRGSPKFGKPLVERTKSDPYESHGKNLRRNVLMHQKSIDLTPQQSEETTSDYDNEEYLKKTSRSEHDIPYILHKRHCMNGTARTADLSSAKADIRNGRHGRPDHKENIVSPVATVKKTYSENFINIAAVENFKIARQKGPERSKATDLKKPGLQIINLDLKNNKTQMDVLDSTKTYVKTVKPSIAKKPVLSDNKEGRLKSVGGKETKKVEPLKPATKPVPDKTIKESNDKGVEPIYAEVYKGKIVDKKDLALTPKKIPPEPPKRTSSVQQKPASEGAKLEAVIAIAAPSVQEKKIPPEPPKRTTSAQKLNERKSLEGIKLPNEEDSRKISPEAKEAKRSPEEGEQRDQSKGREEITAKPLHDKISASKGKGGLPVAGAVLQRREESLLLFARTRLGLSEGSAFIPIVRQNRVGSPTSQRRAKSLDAPYVSVHRLPPADAYSSKDDTVDNNEEDIVKSAVARAREVFKDDLSKFREEKVEDHPPVSKKVAETDNEPAATTDEENSFKKAVESQRRLEMAFVEEKVLDGVRSKRLLSKIESVDAVDSEGDMDSSKLADPVPIPSDRMVNLPESVRFPSVRQISGQTSEESADGWDHKEVKVKRRTPRRSVGRDETEAGARESVVWDSKDDEPPDDDVWDDSLVFAGKYEGSVVADAVVSTEYLKRGSCGQSIDDDNLSTPMKESSPEHWVSVDDLPEALEREEKLLRQQEKILREKILNEKLKRELNLDTIDVDERFCDYKDSLRQKQEEDAVVMSKDMFKGHSLDTYELTEKRLRERGTNKNSSLDEHLLGDKLIKDYVAAVSNLSLETASSYDNILEPSKYERRMDYIKCKVVNDVTEIDQFGDNDEELEEFFVVLDENLEEEKERRKEVASSWDEEDTYRGNVSKEESLISVPEEFKDVEELDEIPDGTATLAHVEIRLSEAEGRDKRLMTGEEHILASQLLQEKLDVVAATKNKDPEQKEAGRLPVNEAKNMENSKLGSTGEVDRLSPYGGSRRGSEEHRKQFFPEDTGRLSPYDYSSRRSSDDPRRLSGSEEAGRLSPFSDSRRGSEDPRRLSASEDSRKYSMSESVSEETRRRLSSTEETRRKRASLTKQCSVGADSLSDDMISGIQECSSSFEQDEKDVFEAEPETGKAEEAEARKSEERELKKNGFAGKESVPMKSLEIEVSEDMSSVKDAEEVESSREKEEETNGIVHLAPPASERELSRETEDSVDYGEGDFKDIRDTVKEKDISGDASCDGEATRPEEQSLKLPSSFEKSESSEGDELRYIDEKRGSTPEIIVGKSREAVAMSVVVVNEGISVLNKMVEKERWLKELAKAQSLPREVVVTSAGREPVLDEQRHTLPKAASKPKLLSPKSVDKVDRMPKKVMPNVKANAISSPAYCEKSSTESLNFFKSSLDSSLESDIDKISDISLISHVQSQIARRNLSDTGKRLRRDESDEREKEKDWNGAAERKTSSEEEAAVVGLRTSSDEREKTESSSFDMKSSADECALGENGKWKAAKGDRFKGKSNLEVDRSKREGCGRAGKERKSPEQEKRDSGEDGSSSSSAPPHPKRELSSTWKPFLLESSGSSSLEEGWLPPDDNAHLADEEETSSTSNNQQDDSYHDDIDYPTGIGYPVLNISSAEMMVGGYGGVYALSRTLSRISERSTSEQERSDAEDDITKPSSHSVSAEEESILSSDHQPSLSSDPPSPRESSSRIPDLPDDGSSIPECFAIPEDRKGACEPFGDVIPPPVPDDDWPSPPSSSSVFDTPVVSHIETFYMEIHPEEACKVIVAAEPRNEENSSSDENQTLHEEGELLHLSSDNMSASTTTTTQDGTVIIPIRPRSARTGSGSEDTSMVSTSEWSASATTKPRANSVFGPSEDSVSDRTKGSAYREPAPGKIHRKLSGDDVSLEGSTSQSRRQSQSCYSIYNETTSEEQNSPRTTDVGAITPKYYSDSHVEPNGQKPKVPAKIKPPKLKSPPGKNMGFFETPVSKVRSPTSQGKFFEVGDKGTTPYSNLRSPTSFSETTSPKNYGRFFESCGSQVHRIAAENSDLRKTRSPSKGKHEPRKENRSAQQNVCTPYYSNVADFAEKSYFGRYDTGSLERTKIHSSRKCCSYHSVSKTAPSDEEDSSNGEDRRTPSSNTIPRASKKTKRRHRVAMDLEIRDGKIVAPPKTRSSVVENSDSDRSSPRDFGPLKDSRKKHSDV